MVYRDVEGGVWVCMDQVDEFFQLNPTWWIKKKSNLIHIDWVGSR